MVDALTVGHLVGGTGRPSCRLRPHHGPRWSGPGPKTPGEASAHFGSEEIFECSPRFLAGIYLGRFRCPLRPRHDRASLFASSSQARHRGERVRGDHDVSLLEGLLASKFGLETRTLVLLQRGPIGNQTRMLTTLLSFALPVNEHAFFIASQEPKGIHGL